MSEGAFRRDLDRIGAIAAAILDDLGEVYGMVRQRVGKIRCPCGLFYPADVEIVGEPVNVDAVHRPHTVLPMFIQRYAAATAQGKAGT